MDSHAQRRSSQPDLFNGNNSADALLEMFNEQEKKSDSGLGSSSQSNSTMNWDRMLSPNAGLESVTQMMESIKTKDLAAVPKPPKIPLDLRPSTGRAVAVSGNVDLGRAFRLMEQSCARNRVRSDATKQRFHERGGMKRKRLRRERWRKKFMEGFKATVGRVKQLKNQGW